MRRERRSKGWVARRATLPIAGVRSPGQRGTNAVDQNPADGVWVTERGHMNREVDTLERFDFGGASQWALVRGRSRSSPVLLFVQQGPGFPMIHEADAIERQLHLEEDFRVVYWDQRGTGKSLRAMDSGALSLDTLVEDVRA